MRHHISRFYIHLGHARFTHPFYGLELVEMIAWRNLTIRFPMIYFQLFFSRHLVLIRLEIMGRGLIHKIFWRTKGYEKYGSCAR